MFSPYFTVPIRQLQQKHKYSSNRNMLHYDKEAFIHADDQSSEKHLQCYLEWRGRIWGEREKKKERDTGMDQSGQAILGRTYHLSSLTQK